MAIGLDTPRFERVKSFSKWEKQDMEAEIMSKIRQELQDRKVTENETEPSPVWPQRSRSNHHFFHLHHGPELVHPCFCGLHTTEAYYGYYDNDRGQGT